MITTVDQDKREGTCVNPSGRGMFSNMLEDLHSIRIENEKFLAFQRSAQKLI